MPEIPRRGEIAFRYRFENSDVFDDFRKKYPQVIDETLREGERQIKTRIMPIDTGNARRRSSYSKRDRAGRFVRSYLWRFRFRFPYAIYLEEGSNRGPSARLTSTGHSTQAPHGFIRPLRQFLKRRLEFQFRKFSRRPNSRR